ncbi:MAG TPA: LTA synthase family protein, partial [Nitrospirae bacterium]|nr:LTA synthase family protein [Nitrospirota bacterium]
VFTTITGLPDVETDRTASRNPMVVRQHTIVDAFKGYEKFYFLGGSLNWANIRGLLMRNIEGLEIHEEGSYRAPRVDVWGISDLHLFEEANNIIREKVKPFFAIIQTSGNHRPYTIPEDNRGFRLRKEDEKKIKDAGFISEEEFNSFRFMDHAIGHFIKQAKKEKYFANTIFVFYGDHGLPGHARHMNRAEDQLTLTTFHVPLLIYAPGLLKGGQVDDKPASEVDVMPMIASLAGIPYLNNTLGRNLLDPKFAGRRYAFTMYHFPAMPQIGVIGEEFVLTMNADGTRRRLHDYHSDSPRENVESMHPGEADKMEALALGLHETAKYLLYNNRPENFR